MGVKKKISQILLAVGIMAVSGFGASVSLMLISNQRIKLARAETTGMGQISGVQILQAGTGASVTIRGETLNENDYGADNASRRTILNNNVVRYRVNYTASGGWIKLTFTMPVNNYIDTASVSGCDSDETHKSEVKAAAVNDKASIVANQAICYINADDGMVSSSWDITTKPLGGNGDTITPSVAVNDEAANVVIDPITVVGRLNYGVVLGSSGGSTHFESGYTHFNLDVGIYMKTDGRANNLGIEPIKGGNYSFDIDMSELPSGWYVHHTDVGGGFDISEGGRWGARTGQSGKVSVSKNGDDTLHIETTGAATAIARCARNIDASGSSRAMSDTRCTQSLMQIGIYVPLTDIPKTSKAYNVKAEAFDFTGVNSAQEADISDATYSYWLTSQVTGSMTTFVDDTNNQYYIAYNPTEEVGWWGNHHYYEGQIVPLRAVMLSNSATNDYSSNNVGCIAWNPSSLLLYSVAHADYDGRTRNNNSLVSAAKLGSDGFPDISNGCGAYGLTTDDNGNTYQSALTTVGSILNLSMLKIESERYSLDDAYWFNHIEFKVLDKTIDGKAKELTRAVASTTEWNSFKNVGVRKYTMIPGLLMIDLAANDSTNVSSTGTLSITPRTYNQDTNSKIIVTLPKYLTVVNGSLKTGEYTLKKDTDYALASNDDGTSTVTIDMDKLEANMVAAGKEAHITGEQPTYDSNGIPTAADNGGKGVERTPITLDYQVDAAAVTPATATITVETTGDGTAHATTIARRKTVNVSLASQPNSIGMTTRTSSGSNNALSLTAKVGGVATGYIDSSVRTNGIEGGYSLTMNADGDASLSDGKHALSTINEPVAGQNGWSLRLDSTDGTSTGQWRKVPASSSPLTILSSAEATSAASIRSTFGFATSVTQPAGTYTGRVIYTLTSGL